MEIVDPLCFSLNCKCSGHWLAKVLLGWVAYEFLNIVKKNRPIEERLFLVFILQCFKSYPLVLFDMRSQYVVSVAGGVKCVKLCIVYQ